MTISDTVECIESIKNNIKYENLSIVVVDNGSPNGTGKKLLKKYADDSKVDILISKENLGFSQGNNIGFKFAKYEKKSDFIVMTNNDTYIKQEDFCKNIINLYKREKFHICGPNIISTVDNKKQNPIPKIFNNINDVIRMKNKFLLLLKLNYIRCDNIIEKFIELKNQLKSKKTLEVNNNDIQIHGSCMMFSPLYIKMYDGLYDKTFMYLEECILKYISDRDGLNMIYSEDMCIYHKEDSATNAIMNKGYKKRRFYYINSINSCNELIKLMKKR